MSKMSNNGLTQRVLNVIRVVAFFYLLLCFIIITFNKTAENIIEISRTTGVLVDPVYNIKAIRGMLTEMKNNPGRFKGKRILYVHTGTRLIYASDIRAVYTRENKPRLTIAAAYIRRERNHLYEYGLY